MQKLQAITITVKLKCGGKQEISQMLIGHHNSGIHTTQKLQ